MQRYPTTPFGFPDVGPTPQGPFAGIQNFAQRIGASPLFMGGLTMLAGQGPGAGAQIAQATQQGRMQQAEYARAEQQRRQMQEAWGRLFPDGQSPAMDHPLAQNTPAELLTLAQSMGPEQGLRLLGNYQLSRADPLKRQEAEAGIANTHAQTQYYLAQARSKAEAAGFKTNVVGGKLIAYDANGNTQVLYDGDVSGDPAKLSGIAGGLNDLAAIPGQFNKDTFERAVGPLQGGDSYFFSPLARAWGSITNGGADRSTTEVRNMIAGSTEALAASIKPLIRKPGEGTWTDQDQARLVSIVGNLATASNKEEYDRALEGVRRRLMANFGINLPPIGAASAAAPADTATRKTIAGRTYFKQNGQWYEE